MTTAPEIDLSTTTDLRGLVGGAFKHVNAGELGPARVVLERGLGLYPKDVMLTHVWAHMVDGSRELAEGANELRELLAGADTTHGLHAHTSWHLAAVELELGQAAEAFERYELCVAPYVPERPIMFYSAVALLWGLELVGFGRGGGRQLPWEHLQTARERILATPAKPGGMANPPALDHFGHGVVLVATGEEVGLATLLDELRAAGDGLFGEVVAPAIVGMRAFWKKDDAAAIELLEPVVAASGRMAGTAEPLPLILETLAVARRG